MTKLRWGILAAGNIARRFVSDLQLSGRAVSAIGSRSAERAAAFAAEFGLPHAHGSYEALAKDPTVDAIYIATANPSHIIAAEIAINAGKHVLIEKPLTLNAAEAQRLLELGEAHDVVVLEAMWTRFFPHMIRLREMLADGVIGEVRTMLATHTQSLTADPAHRLNALELGGGALLDLGVYPVSFAFDILGEPQTIQATGHLRPTGADAEVTGILRYANGATMSFIAASDAPGPNRAEICGTRGYIEIDRTWYMPTTFRVYDTSSQLIEEYTSNVQGRGMQFQAAELERLVADGERSSPIMPIAQSVAIMAALDNIRAQIGVIYPE
ncbi:Gfo/Idh/MocA family oxidoreductase [Devosia sp. J2-20]|uniref:Gfo/Idh/MocA family protein n=1 Tax=Devosia sp. J2-20 TaxID=3026161 RepID=UPI002499F13E|nr:Gfo/Idh/MocA family oxidoreductase [Devosia sp. J2-20]WDQ98640.1 Gfo/Idh/MocA family oxidoreductase [Devosia sp. J2-20]